MTDAQMMVGDPHEPHHNDHEHHVDPAAALENAKFATWLYIGSEVMLFAAMLAAYLIFRVYNVDVVREAQEHLSILLVSMNTFLLLASSWMMVMGLRQIQLGNRRGLMVWLSGTVILGALFVALQVVEYAELVHAGIVLTGGTDLAAYGQRFYAPTAFHGAHVVAGCLWGIWVINKAYRGGFSATSYAAVEVFGLYWHFVDVVWIILFTFIYLV